MNEMMMEEMRGAYHAAEWSLGWEGLLLLWLVMPIGVCALACALDYWGARARQERSLAIAVEALRAAAAMIRDGRRLGRAERDLARAAVDLAERVAQAEGLPAIKFDGARYWAALGYGRAHDASAVGDLSSAPEEGR
jgi:hypothetical protein